MNLGMFVSNSDEIIHAYAAATSESMDLEQLQAITATVITERLLELDTTQALAEIAQLRPDVLSEFED